MADEAWMNYDPHSWVLPGYLGPITKDLFHPKEMKNQHFAEIMKRLFLDEATADVQFIFEITDDNQIANTIEKRIPAHKWILAAGSPVFDAMFNGHFIESKTGEAKIVDATPEEFTDFLRFFYFGDVTNAAENVTALKYLAEKYDVPICLSVCEQFLAQKRILEQGRTRGQRVIDQFESRHSAETMMKLYRDQNSADVELRCKELPIPAHKFVLATGSPVFANFFEVECDYYSTDANFIDYLLCFYADKVFIHEGNVANLMYYAEQFETPLVMKMCDRYLEQAATATNIWEFYNLSLEFRRTDLKSKLIQKIRHDAVNIFRWNQFEEFSYYELKHFLEIGGFVCCPVVIFNACKRWAKISCEKNADDPSVAENWRKHLADCLYLIPFRSMKPTDITVCISLFRKLFDDNELNEMVAMATGEPKKSGRFLLKRVKPNGEKLDFEILTSKPPKMIEQKRLNPNELIRCVLNDPRCQCFAIVTGIIFAPIQTMCPSWKTQRLSAQMLIVEMPMYDFPQKILVNQQIWLNVNTMKYTRVQLSHPIVCTRAHEYKIWIAFNSRTKQSYSIDQRFLISDFLGKKIFGIYWGSRFSNSMIRRYITEIRNWTKKDQLN